MPTKLKSGWDKCPAVRGQKHFYTKYFRKFDKRYWVEWNRRRSRWEIIVDDHYDFDIHQYTHKVLGFSEDQNELMSRVEEWNKEA